MSFLSALRGLVEGYAFPALLAVRVAGALSAPILDCDEVFNYWEPLHFLLFGRGLQTWEYSPEFALRTWAYIGLHALPAGLWILQNEQYQLQEGVLNSGVAEIEPNALKLVEPLNKVWLFFLLRAAYGTMCALGESAFVGAVRRRFGLRVAALTLLFLAFNTGMFHSGSALLPSTTCMLGTLFGYSTWLRGNALAGCAFGAFVVLLSWPFCAFMFVPMGLDALHTKGLVSVVLLAIGCIVTFVGLPAMLDSALYGGDRPTFAIINLVLYNALGIGGKDGQGADLYGTEPWHFYFQNLLLNFNLIALLALISPLVVLAFYDRFQNCDEQKKSTNTPSKWMVLTWLAGTFLTLGIFSTMAHKEERFLTPIYPMFCLGAALSAILALDVALYVFGNFKPLRVLLQLGFGAMVMLACTLCLSRSIALHVNFYAPMPVFERLGEEIWQQLEQQDEKRGHVPLLPVNVCLSKEWYRFPSSFFLPRGVRVRWLRSSFDGMLPQPFSRWPQGTSFVHRHFNDRNERDEAAYSSLQDCDWAVDLDVGSDHGDIGTPWSLHWDTVFCMPFMDAERSPALVRSFFIPGYSRKANVFANYCLLRKKNPNPA